MQVPSPAAKAGAFAGPLSRRTKEGGGPLQVPSPAARAGAGRAPEAPRGRRWAWDALDNFRAITQVARASGENSGRCFERPWNAVDEAQLLGYTWQPSKTNA